MFVLLFFSYTHKYTSELKDIMTEAGILFDLTLTTIL